jgi:hypothetical protein
MSPTAEDVAVQVVVAVADNLRVESTIGRHAALRSDREAAILG